MIERLDEERIHMENIVNSRFNYLLLILAVIIAAVMGAKTESQVQVLFFFGLIISLGLGWTIIRAKLRLGILMDQIYLNDKHAARFARDEAAKANFLNPARYSAIWIIGYLFPIALIIFMSYGAFKPSIVFVLTSEESDLKIMKLSIGNLESRLTEMEKVLMTNNNNVQENVLIDSLGK